MIGMAVTPPRVVRGPANRAFRFSVKATALIGACGVLVIGQDFGWWGEKPLTCQQPGAQTTATDAKVVTAATIGQRQGEWLRKLNGPPPTAAEVNALADRAAEGVVVYVAALTAAARDRKQSEYVEKYNRKRKVAKEKQLAQHIAMCSPSCPQAQPNGQPLTVANRGTLTSEQQGNAGTIASVGAARGIPVQGRVVAVAAALQESGLRNLTYGDRDSVGVLQQRAGWGSVAERMNVTVAAGKFYDALERVPGWQSMTVAQAAQAVQRSKYPNAYARWESQARSLVGGATVQPVAGGMTCASYQTTGKGPGAWGGYANGRIPTTALAHPRTAPRHLFRPDAAADFDRLNAAFTAAFGKPLGVTDSYRSYGAQVDVKGRKPGLAAKPGTSNHGWGLAADVVLSGFSDPRYAWLQANGARYGWISPDWAKANGSRPEFWHLDYTGKSAAA